VGSTLCLLMSVVEMVKLLTLQGIISP